MALGWISEGEGPLARFGVEVGGLFFVCHMDLGVVFGCFSSCRAAVALFKTEIRTLVLLDSLQFCDDLLGLLDYKFA